MEKIDKMMNRQPIWNMLVIYPVIFTMLVTVISSQDIPYSISQISPKSQIYDESVENIMPSIVASFQETTELSVEEDTPKVTKLRIERSAMPALDDVTSLNHFETNDVESSGRYFSPINPTTTRDAAERNQRTGKDLMDEDSFLGERGRRAKSSRPQNLTVINPTSAMPQTEPIATKRPNTNDPRQNTNPDIKDIITGIVKLLNGNVNVHANNQGNKRPPSNRINNRGPPRISDAQVPPNEQQQLQEQQTQQQQLQPPKPGQPYPFDRPEGPLRPFLTGVPLPEQIVPSMQQNYRPGFISQNRPPWQRPRPRPPINANRRPIPPYRPIPTLPEYRPEEETSLNHNVQEPGSDDKLSTSLESDMDNESYEDDDVDEEDSIEEPVTKEDLNKKKDNKKVAEKKLITPIVNIESIKPTPSIVTIIQSTSEVNTIQHLEPTTETTMTSSMTTEKNIESSFNDVTTQTTAVVQETPSLIPVSTVQKPYSQPSGLVISTPILDQQQTQFQPSQNFSYHPRPGLVLDDPEFKPGQKQPTSQNQNPLQRPRVPPPQLQPNLPPGYGEIFDITLSAIQGPSGGGSQQTVQIKPYGSYEGSDIILSASGDQGFVSIDGKRTYIDLFGESTNAPTIIPTPTLIRPQIKPTPTLQPGITGSGYVIAETEPTVKKPHPNLQQRPMQQHPIQQRPRVPAQQPPVRIDTCIVGDDSTCDKAQNEKCKTENGVSSCNCRPGYARRKHRDPCRRVVSLVMSLRVDKIYDRRVAWDHQLSEFNSEPYLQLSYEATRAIDSAMSMTPYSDEFMEAKVNNIYQGDPAQGLAGVFVNMTMMIEENGETIRPALKSDIQRHLLGVIHRRNNNIGNSALYVESPPGSVSNLQDLDECQSPELHDCHPEAICSNVWGGFRCDCSQGFKDPHSDQVQRAGRECQTCSESFCNNRGTCSFDNNGQQVCTCIGSYYGNLCEIDGEVLVVAIGASVAAVIIIILTLICLVMWSRRWQREHKNAMVGSPVFGYLGGGQVKTPVMGQTPYQVTLEDRMRWAQIADVMAQANHYGVEPVASTRPSSAIFGYPHLQTISGMNTLGGMSMGGMHMLNHNHNGTLPPVPLPRNFRLGLRPNGMRTLENSSSSEEEDRTDLLGRNFQVPRPKSRSNASVTNQSGIYYDVDYAPSGEHHLYGTATNTTSASSHNQMKMSTYTPGRAPSSTYYK